jgi:hypothetical protein
LKTSRYRLSILTFLSAAGLLAGSCTRQDPEPPGEPIRFQVVEEWQPMNTDTRAVLYGGGALGSGSFGVNAYLNGSSTKYIDSVVASYQSATSDWRFNDDYFWPASPTTLDFMAWMPASRANTCVGVPTCTSSSGPSFSVTDFPVTSAGQGSLQEFVYAYKTGQNKASQGASGVTLAFRRPFAQLTFQVKAGHQALHINTVTFKNIKRNGTFTHNAPDASPAVPSAWATSGNNADLVITVGVDLAAGAIYSASQLTSFGLPFLVIPQSYTATNQIVINLQRPTGSTAETITVSNPISVWEAGKSYTYSLDLSDGIKFSVTVASWSADSSSNSQTLTFGE